MKTFERVNKGTVSAILAVMALLGLFETTLARGRETKDSALPSNLILSKDAKRTLEKVWKRSPTFRHQCRRIAEVPWLKIRLRFAPKSSNRYSALTNAQRNAEGPVSIAVQIFVTGSYVEMIGHEFEHVLEQIEGIDLKALSLKWGSGVRRSEDGTYETERAVRAGRKVSAEYRDAKMAGNAQA